MNSDNNDIQIPVCGGVIENRISGLNDIIESDDIIYFQLTSNMDTMLGDIKYRYISLFAGKMENDKTYLVYKTKRSPESTVAITDFPLLKKLQKIVKENNLSRNNGYSHYVSGLSDNFGGSIDIRYSSNERIYHSDNQGAVISAAISEEMTELFIEAAKPQYCSHNSFDSPLQSFDYYQLNNDKSYYLYQLRKDKSGYQLFNERAFPKYGKQVYQEKIEVDREVMENIDEIFKKNCLHAFINMMVGERTDSYSVSTLTFTFENGNQYIVKDNLNIPLFLDNTCFNIYMYLEEQFKKNKK